MIPSERLAEGRSKLKKLQSLSSVASDNGDELTDDKYLRRILKTMSLIPGQ